MTDLLPSHYVAASQQATYSREIMIRHESLARIGRYPSSDELEACIGSIKDVLSVELTQQTGHESRTRLRAALNTLTLDLEPESTSPEAKARRDHARAILKAEAPTVFNEY